MSRRGNCYDNAVMVSCFSTVKTELADRFDSCSEAKRELFDYIEVFYNQRRRNRSTNTVCSDAIVRGTTWGNGYRTVARLRRTAGVRTWRPTVLASVDG